MSVQQGEKLSDLLRSFAWPWNVAWGGNVAEVSNAHEGVQLPGGMLVTVLSPRRTELQSLATFWKKELARSAAPKTSSPVEPPPMEGGDDAEAAFNDNPARRDVLVISARKDQRWAKLIKSRSAASKHAEHWRFWSDDGQTREANLEQALYAAVTSARVGVLLVSPALLASNFFQGVLSGVVKRSKDLALELTTVVVTQVSGDQRGVGALNPLIDPVDVLDQLPTPQRDDAIERIVQKLEAIAGLEPEAEGLQLPLSINVEALANSKFVGDKSVVNASSIAFLAELRGRAVLVGGDARPDVLQESIASLLSRRGTSRLRLDAFVVPHAGSKSNLSRELLALLDCDRYLFSTDGRAFNHPHRETVARIITYGRTSSERQPTLVFNYRSPANNIWADPELQQRYGYVAVYPESGTAGVKVQL